MKSWIGWVLLLAVVFVTGCSSEGERGRNRDKDAPRSAPEKDAEGGKK